jgi:phosphatidylglycerophosphatase A
VLQFFLGTTFYTSLVFKKAPGTMSSLAVFAFFFLIDEVPAEYKMIMLVGLAIAHLFCFPYFQKRYLKSDPSMYTLDEAFAMVLLSIPFPHAPEWIVAFLLFRLFDIWKPLGIRKFERLEKIPLLIRNIADDVIAAFYTCIVMVAYGYVV